jgi:hypothetical protein
MKNNCKATVLLIVFNFVLLFKIFAQVVNYSEQNQNQIILTSILPEGYILPEGVGSFLISKLNQLTTKNGIGNNGDPSQFVIMAKPELIFKEITSSAPAKIILTLEVSFYVGDGFNGILFSSTSLRVKGVGDTDTKAYLSALKLISVSDSRLETLINEGKDKIITYYTNRCPLIIAEARTLASQRKFDEAIAMLMVVPDVSRSCFDSARKESILIFNNKLELECQQHISAAKSLIAQNNWEAAAKELLFFTPEMKCYAEVSNLLDLITDHNCAVALGKANAAWAARNIEEAAMALGNIPTDSDCAVQAKKISAQISSSLAAQEKAKWDLAYEKYNRNQVLREKESIHQQNLENRQMSYKEKQGFELEKSKVQAIKEIGVAYGKNQPRKVTYNVGKW